jgi:hypothetical protein
MTLGPLSFSPAAFWLAPPVLAALILLRLYRSRRRELLTGSLLLWRRLAAQPPPARPKRLVVDRALLLQAATLLLLIAALAAPSWALGGRGRTLLLVLDNGPLCRARLTTGERVWDRVRDEAARILRELKSEDRVYLARTAPVPGVLETQGLSPSQALDAAGRQTAALSGPEAGAVLLFAANTGRTLGRGQPLATVILSPGTPPQELLTPAADSSLRWLCVAPPGVVLSNVAIVDFGSAVGFEDGQSTFQVLARLRNFSPLTVQGTVRLERFGGDDGDATQELACRLESLGETAVTFLVPARPALPLRMEWRQSDDHADALPEDDVVVAVPKSIGPPRIRFHAPVPALEQLYRSALDAVIVPRAAEADADLDVFSGSVPERVPQNTRAFMLLAPDTGYRSVFDVGRGTLTWPKAQRDEDDPLTKGIGDKPESAVLIPKARELLRTCDFKTLLADSATHRPLVARFVDEYGRQGYLFAFIPGAGRPPEQLLEPALAALLLRVAREAAGGGEPYVVTTAKTLELRTGAPLPLDWRPGPESGLQGGPTPRRSGSRLGGAWVGRAGGAGVLDEATSNLELGAPSPLFKEPLPPVLTGPSFPRELRLEPWLLALALLLACVEWRLDVFPHAKTPGRKAE